MVKCVIDRSKLKDDIGKPLTQALFIEYGYDPTLAIYSWGNEDKEYKGIIYPSLKKLYLAEEDLSEYRFAKTHLLGWFQWQKMNSNKVLKEHIDTWREELYLIMRSEGIESLIDQASNGNFQAAKWLAEGLWEKKGAGRPTKESIQKEAARLDKLRDEYEGDISRLAHFAVVKK